MGVGEGGADLKRRRFSMERYTKMKEFGPVGGRPPGSAHANKQTYVHPSIFFVKVNLDVDFI